MNILIVTPLNPVDVMEVYLECTLHMSFDDSLFFSIPAMALLGEETMQDSKITYEQLLTMFLHSFHNTEYAKNMFKKDQIQIFIGTLPKNIVKPDYIVAMVPPYREEDNYIDSTTQHITAITQIYTIQDADIIFPSYHHLETFLKTLNIPRKEIKENTESSEVQPETTDSSR